MSMQNLVGQTLDGKYKIERELGKGGMGAVYLATHVGTERPVAVKVIMPQFMQRAEFVERFRREARAAGRLRHPNVVDVTDFGYCREDSLQGNIAYLVMEYLDGCTLGEILDEEKQLPLGWTLDILEQICSAVAEAHAQGIIHRDLKPDNIWLEPNQRGGYTVKVLDFGIAKLETQNAAPLLRETSINSTSNSHQTNLNQPQDTLGATSQENTVADNGGNATVLTEKKTIIQTAPEAKVIAPEAGTLIQEAGTLLQISDDVDLESGTAILPPAPLATVESENQGTRLLSQSESAKPELSSNSAALTRVGAVLGTPLYMSPEQCRGEKLTAQSDIYSLGVIAYQMLSGKTPFSGDYTEVMRSHREVAPPNLENKKIPVKIKRVISAAMSKNIADRPPTAQAFASEMRARSEGIGVLLQRALVIYFQYLPKFLSLALLVYLPYEVATVLQIFVSFLALNDSIGEISEVVLKILLVIVTFFSAFFCGYLIMGTTTWIVSQILAAPLRPVKLRPAFKIVKSKWRNLAFTGSLSTAMTLTGYALCFVPGIILSVIWALVAPVVMMENLRGKAALKRSKTLVKRSLRTTTAAIFIMFLVPMLTSALITFTVRAFTKNSTMTPAAQAAQAAAKDEDGDAKNVAPRIKPIGIHFDVDDDDKTRNDSKTEDTGTKLRSVLREAFTQILLLPFTILMSSFSAIVFALLYLKTRQAGGESVVSLLTQFRETDQPHSNWQKRVQERLEQSGRMTSQASRAETGQP